MNSICSRLSKRLLLFPTVGFFRTTFARDHTIRLNTEFLFIHLQVALGMLVASTCSVMLFKRKQKLKTWKGLNSLPPEWLPHRVTIESTDTSANEYTGFIKESWKEQKRPPLLRQAAKFR